MSDPIRSAEDVAREVLGCERAVVEPGLPTSGVAYCAEHHCGWLSDVDMCPRQESVADLIRARDAEVAEQARAETLAEFTEERTDRMIPRRVPCDCPGDWQHHGRFAGDGGPETHVSLEAVPSRRLVGPWEPVEP